MYVIFVLVCVPHSLNVSSPGQGPRVSRCPWRPLHSREPGTSTSAEWMSELDSQEEKTHMVPVTGSDSCGLAATDCLLLSWKPRLGSPPCSVRHGACHLGEDSLYSGDVHLPLCSPVSNSDREGPQDPRWAFCHHFQLYPNGTKGTPQASFLSGNAMSPYDESLSLGPLRGPPESMDGSLFKTPFL